VPFLRNFHKKLDEFSHFTPTLETTPKSWEPSKTLGAIPKP